MFRAVALFAATLAVASAFGGADQEYGSESFHLNLYLETADGEAMAEVLTDLADYVEQLYPGVLTYAFLPLNEDKTSWMFVETYLDNEVFVAHLNENEFIGKLGALIASVQTDVFGDPNEASRELLAGFNPTYRDDVSGYWLSPHADFNGDLDETFMLVVKAEGPEAETVSALADVVQEGFPGVITYAFIPASEGSSTSWTLVWIFTSYEAFLGKMTSEETLPFVTQMIAELTSITTSVYGYPDDEGVNAILASFGPENLDMVGYLVHEEL